MLKEKQVEKLYIGAQERWHQAVLCEKKTEVDILDVAYWNGRRQALKEVLELKEGD